MKKTHLFCHFRTNGDGLDTLKAEGTIGGQGRLRSGTQDSEQGIEVVEAGIRGILMYTFLVLEMYRNIFFNKRIYFENCVCGFVNIHANFRPSVTNVIDMCETL